jgi:quercetin dioxygenase-like cupin family protein
MKPALSQLVARSLAVVALLAAPIAAQAQGGHIMALPNDLKWADVPSLPPGAKIAVIKGSMSQPGPFTIRLKFPANYQIPPHSHPAIERVTVLSGTFNMGSGDTLDRAKTHALPAGGIVIIPIGSNHYAWTAEETIVQLNGIGPWGVTYVNPADDPRKK